MTEETLAKIIEGAKAQVRYEDDCYEALRVIFPDIYPSIFVNPIWQAFATAVDEALGVEDLFDWWVWETKCGTKDNSWIELGGVRYPLTNAREILEYAEAERRYMEQMKNR